MGKSLRQLLRGVDAVARFCGYMSGCLVLFMVALIRPLLLRPVNRIWLKAGHLLGRINSFIILSVIFYVVFTPMRLLVRIFSKEKKFAFNLPGDSYWMRRKQEDFRETMKRQF